ncbi:MAG: chondroitin lyase, partial [Calditrichaeota bacterium]
TLGPHPLSHKQAPGKLFHQTLNEEVWLVYVSQAYDCIYNWLSPGDRALFEKNIFRPMVHWFAVKNEHEFNRIHNHGTWATAAVGMIGYVMHDQELVDMALYGTKKDGNGGFLRQLDLLFSPDGYYMEGPYYIRYALRPFFLFAEAIERNQPDLKIFEYRNKILKKAFYAAAQTIFPNGVFPPINDASRTMNIKAPGPLIAHNITYARYGGNANLLAIAGIQGKVFLNPAGLQVARDFAAAKQVPVLNWASVEFTDGYDGKRGGLGILRMGRGMQQTMLLMKYGVHGKGHGHFDKLHFILFDQGREVVPDYGFCRWINIEPKFGGRYLPENTTYAKQTIAHNTLVVDETCQNNGDRKAADKVWGQRHFFDAAGDRVKVMSARALDHYPGVAMQRTMFLIKDARLLYPVVVDVFRATSTQEHQYDYPIHFLGQLISTNLEYRAHVDVQRPLGIRAGYQHIWKEASGTTNDVFKLTWLDGHRYYSLVTSPAPGTEIIFGRTGANDPNFNLRSEPMVIVRRKAQNDVFAAVIEPHGYFNEAEEKSMDARGLIESVAVIGDNAQASVIEVRGKNGLRWEIGINNGEASKSKTIAVTFRGKTYTWTGNYSVQGVKE